MAISARLLLLLLTPTTASFFSSLFAPYPPPSSPGSNPNPSPTLIHDTSHLFPPSPPPSSPGSSPIRLCMLMIGYNEAPNILSNLPTLAPLFDCYVLGVDRKTTDMTASAVINVMGDTPGCVFEFEYEGLGRGRSLTIDVASDCFPEADHWMVVDPDWRIATGNSVTAWDKNVLRGFTNVFFKVHDRNRNTSRWLDWLVVAEPRNRVSMRYRWHEMWHYSKQSNVETMKKALVPWEVEEVDSDDNWHREAHGGSFSYSRYIFEIGELEQDLKTYGKKDSRLLYYLGFDHLAAYDAGVKEQIAEIVLEGHVKKAKDYLARRAGPVYTNVGKEEAIELEKDRRKYGTFPSPEMSYSALQYMGIMSWRFDNDGEKAKEWYGKCVEFDKEDFRCFLSWSQLLLDLESLDSAVELGGKALALGMAGKGTAQVVNRDTAVSCDLGHHVLLLKEAGAVVGSELVEQAVRSFDDLDRCKPEVAVLAEKYGTERGNSAVDWDGVVSEETARKLRRLPEGAQTELFGEVFKGVKPAAVKPAAVKQAAVKQAAVKQAAAVPKDRSESVLIDFSSRVTEISRDACDLSDGARRGIGLGLDVMAIWQLMVVSGEGDGEFKAFVERLRRCEESGGVTIA